jgi:hypothetical protein
MANLDHHDTQFAVLDGVNDSVDALANTAAFLARKSLDSGGTGVIGKRLDPFDDSLAILLVSDRLDLLNGRRLDDKVKSCHAASDP